MSAKELYMVFELSPLPTFIVKGSSIIWVNQKMTEFTGYTKKDLINSTVSELFHRDDFIYVTAKHQECINGTNTPESCIVRIKTLSGQIKHTKFISYTSDNLPGFIIQHLIDISDLKQKEEELRISEANYRSIYDSANDAIFVHDYEGKILDVNARALEMFGYSDKKEALAPENIDLDNKKRINNDSEFNKEEVLRKIRLAAKGEAQVFEWLAIHKNGCPIWVEVNLKKAVIGGKERILAVVREISKRKKAEEKLIYFSLHDPLTGLRNRNYFEQEVLRLEEAGSLPVGVIICDLDGLKIVNDTYGHTIGDALLRAAAKAIKDSFRQDDVVARIGGDEFAVLLNQNTVADVEKACWRIKDLVERHNKLSPHLPLSISIGHAIRESKVHSLKEIIKKADDNMYAEKLRKKLILQNSKYTTRKDQNY